jgi:N-methylhydantoinase B
MSSMSAPQDKLARVAVDPITVEVIGSAMMSIVEEMGEALVKASHSTNIKERRDCSTALFDRHGQALCQADHIPMHLGSFLGIIPHIMKNYPSQDIRPGDVFIANDAYEGGATHLPDIVLAEAIFDGDMLIAWAVNTAHHADFEDRGHAHIYQEGIRIPPLKLYREGVLQEDLQKLFLLNCQVPRERVSDLRAQMAANRLALERMKALCGRYGRDVLLSAGEELMDYAERKMRSGIAAIPDGTYCFVDRFDNPAIDGEMEFTCSIRVDGDEMHLSFDGPDQVRAGLNMVLTALLSTVYYAVKTVVDPTTLPNAGLARPLHVTAREGSILNCVHPAAVNGRIAPCQRVADLIMGALAQAVPHQVTAAGNGACASATFVGTKTDGDLWIYLETIGGGSGARYNKDGLSGVHVHMTNTSNLPAEALEIEYPLTLLRYELVDGSGGAGEYRGGMGLRRVYRAERDCLVKLDGSRLRSQPWGLSGGGPGGLGSYAYSGDSANFDHGNGKLSKGDTVTIITPGAGGYGDPSKRSGAASAADRAQHCL